jgi:hypothetical protein
MIYLLTATGFTPGGSSSVYIYTQTIHKTTQLTQTIHRTIQLTNWQECGPCHVITSYTLAFALKLKKKHEKNSVRVANKGFEFVKMHNKFQSKNMNRRNYLEGGGLYGKIILLYKYNT